MMPAKNKLQEGTMIRKFLYRSISRLSRQALPVKFISHNDFASLIPWRKWLLRIWVHRQTDLKQTRVLTDKVAITNCETQRALWCCQSFFFLLCLLTGCILFLTGTAMAGELLIDEIRAIRAKDNSAIIVIDEIVSKHIPVGTKKEIALGLLEKNGFKCNLAKEVNPEKKTYKETVVCVLNMRKWYSLGFGDEVVTNLYFENEVVNRLSAKIIYRSL